MFENDTSCRIHLDGIQYIVLFRQHALSAQRRHQFNLNFRYLLVNLRRLLQGFWSKAMLTVSWCFIYGLVFAWKGWSPSSSYFIDVQLVCM